MDYKKYQRQYFMPPEGYTDWAEKEYIEKAPVWCSVDLRDGNQSLVVPMDVEQKLAFFKMLVEIGFKEIEVGFPASSETELHFVRKLIEDKLIPEDVTIQVLTQAREQIIEETFEALQGCSRAIIHLYNPVSRVQREAVFGMSEDEVKDLAVHAAVMIRDLCASKRGFSLEYSPESFSAAEPAFALEVCNAVLDVWKPTPERRAIINLPSTVELAMPHVYASQVSFISRNLHYRDCVQLSLHPHNDRGSSISDAELGILAGAERIEGTLFGNGERTGNVDLVTLALNLYSHGVDPHLDFHALNDIRRRYEEYTGMQVYERSPYSGALAFAAFSGSHQDAIAKATAYYAGEKKHWQIPYLPIDPADLGRSRDVNVIRINSQSGKGGVGYILEKHYGIKLPMGMREILSHASKTFSDSRHMELKAEDLYALFRRIFLNSTDPFEVTEVHYRQHNGIIAEVTTACAGRKTVVLASGNGRLNAVSNALKKYYPVSYDLVTYEEHSLEKSSGARAIAYVGISSRKSQEQYWGAGINVDIVQASVEALVCAVNNMAKAELPAYSQKARI